MWIARELSMRAAWNGKALRAHLRSSHHQTVNASRTSTGKPIEAAGDVESGHLHAM
jgi:hypothetical protein